jgi:hypothetical protein
MRVNNLLITLAKQTGGKAGKGHNKTSTIQVMDGHIVIKMFRFKVDSITGYNKALQKAIKFASNRSSIV